MGIALGLKKKFRVIDEDGIHSVIIDDTPTSMDLFLRSSSVIYMADVEEYDPESCSSHNVFCIGREDEEQVICSNCHPTYHTPCVPWQDTCGCENIESMKLRFVLSCLS